MSLTPTAALASFSTCELSDALIKLGLPHGGHLPDVHRASSYPGASEERLCGPAYTVQMVLASDDAAPRLKEHFVDTAEAGSVMIIGAPSREYLHSYSTLYVVTERWVTPSQECKNAVWGGLMTAGAQARGVRGVVISGRCRDIAEHNAAHFPVFSRGHSTLGQSPFTRPSAVQIPLTLSAPPESASDNGSTFPALTVEPGDFVVGDDDGVVVVPKGIVDKVLELAAKGREVDERCMQDIKAGLGVQASFKKHRGK